MHVFSFINGNFNHKLKIIVGMEKVNLLVIKMPFYNNNNEWHSSAYQSKLILKTKLSFKIAVTCSRLCFSHSFITSEIIMFHLIYII